MPDGSSSHSLEEVSPQENLADVSDRLTDELRLRQDREWDNFFEYTDSSGQKKFITSRRSFEVWQDLMHRFTKLRRTQFAESLEDSILKDLGIKSIEELDVQARQVVRVLSAKLNGDIPPQELKQNIGTTSSADTLRSLGGILNSFRRTKK